MELKPETLEKFYQNVKTAVDSLKSNEGWDIGKINCKVDILQAVVVEIEKVSAELGGLTGEQKKKLAVNIINKLIDIPLIPEWTEAIIIEYTIDIFIAFLNKHFGHLWAKSVI